MSSLLCRFEPLDTWFFRESRPHGSIGNSELGSVFPPPVRTLLGALRTLIGDAWHSRHNTDWRQLNELNELKALIGYGDDLGTLSVRGPFLSLRGERLYPATANLMVKDDRYFLLDLGQPVECDLGKVHLPCFPSHVAGLEDLAGSKSAEHCWLTSDGLKAVLSGNAPKNEQVIKRSDLFSEEPRLGIGRDNNRKAVQEGLLYQTRHLRLREGVAVELELLGLNDRSLLPSNAIVRLGGEGRQAALQVEASTNRITPSITMPNPLPTFVLYNLTPAPCAPGLPTGIPELFHPRQYQGTDVWEGKLAGVAMRILSVACNRPLREGGWDMANHKARPVQSLLAPGSVLYVQPLGDLPDPSNFSRLADTTGRGLFAVGTLPLSTAFKG